MISQQINLYQPLLRTQRKIFSLQTMVLISVILLAALTLIGAYARWQLHLLQEQQLALQTQEQQVAARMTELTNRLSADRNPDALAAEVAALEADLAARRTVLARIGQRDAGSNRGFSAQLAGLARQSLDGLWLTGVHLEQGGSRVGLEGNTVTPALLPRYIQKLDQEAAFDGVRFESMRIYRREDTGRYVGFRLASEREDEQDQEEGQ